MGAWNERPRVLCLVIVPRTVELSKTRPARILYFVYDARARAPVFSLGNCRARFPRHAINLNDGARKFVIYSMSFRF